MYDQSLRSLPLLKAEETAPKISHWCLVSTSHDGFRSHGNLTPPVGDGSLHRKCFIVSVENLRCSIMKKRKPGRARGKFYAFRRAANPKHRLDVRLPRELSLSQTPANLLSVGFGQEAAHASLPTTLSAPPRTIESKDIPTQIRPSACPRKTTQHGFRV